MFHEKIRLINSPIRTEYYYYYLQHTIMPLLIEENDTPFRVTMDVDGGAYL